MPPADDGIDALALRVVRAVAADAIRRSSRSDVRSIARARDRLADAGERFDAATERARAEFVARVVREWVEGRAGR